MAAHWWASVYHDTVSRLGDIRAPTLVMHGDADAMASPDNARMLAAQIPDAELALVPGAGHAYLLEDPETSHALLADWLGAPLADRAGPRAPRVGRARRAGHARARPARRRRAHRAQPALHDHPTEEPPCGA